jgi:hypothetical protein
MALRPVPAFPAINDYPLMPLGGTTNDGPLYDLFPPRPTTNWSDLEVYLATLAIFS